MTIEKNWKSELQRLAEKETEALQGGGQERLDKLKSSGRLTARERLEYILDEGSFTELNMLAEHQCQEFGMADKKFTGDGVVTGFGTIQGRKVFIYAEDETVLGGSTGKVHGQKIHYLLRLARENRAPVIGLNASAGARIQEGMDNVYGVTGMFYQNSLNSGVIPQIAGIMGTCSGGAAYSAALCDFVVQVKDTSHLFLTGPAVIREVTGEEVSFEDLGGAGIHARVSGVTHLTAENDRDCLDKIRALLDYLPQSNLEKPAARASTDPLDRLVPELIDLVPIKMSKTYDMKKVISAIVDDGELFEIHAAFAKNMVCCFARLGGEVTGIIANNPRYLGGCLDLDSADKAARFIRTCDAFNIPLVTLVDVPGFRPGVAQEHAGIIRHGAKMLYAWTEASVPKVSMILRKMYGGSIPAMGVHEIGFDQVYAWPSAEMQMLGAEPSVRILYRRELEKSAAPDTLFQQKVLEYRDTYLSPYHSSSRLVLDGVIHPQDTRKTIIRALRMLQAKKEAARTWRKHGNIPL